jgi:hypothetical protein
VSGLQAGLPSAAAHSYLRRHVRVGMWTGSKAWWRRGVRRRLVCAVLVREPAGGESKVAAGEKK